jgi:diguanylate cyclase (GGDEF)-like protein
MGRATDREGSTLAAARPRHEAWDRARADLLLDLLRRQPLLAGLNTLVALLAAAALAGRADGDALATWLGGLLVLQSTRVGLWWWYRGLTPDREPPRPLSLLLTLKSTFSGGAWGLFAILFHDRDGSLSGLLAPFVLAGMSASAITALPSHPPALFTFILAALLPYTVFLLMEGGRAALVTAAINLVFLAGLSLAGLRLYRSLRRATKLYWRNLRLVRRLETAREDLERRVELRTAELQAANTALVQEVSQRRRSERQVRHILAHDPLTNLPNRVLFLDRLGQALTRARRYGGSVAVIAFDVDRFKEVNDTYGHPAGDALLRDLAARVAASVRATDTAARIGGDEFALVAPDVDGRDGAVRLAEKLLDVCGAPFSVEGARLPVTLSVGVALFPEHGGEVEDLLTAADLALYGAKAAGRGRWILFSSEMRVAAQSRRRLEAQLREAAPKGELSLLYQPRFSLHHSQRVVGAEALLRWQHPELGGLAPGAFIEVAETSGAIRDIGRWVLDAACGQARRWRDAGRPVRVAVNLSAVEFRQPDLAERIGETLAAADLEPSLLELEITESAYMDQRAAGLDDALRRIRTLGVRLAIDDFGTGYSSLSYLKWVPFDVLKIDRSFVENMVEDQRDEAIVSTIVTLARNLDKTVVAEGVEDERQLDALRRLGCHEAQGYLLGRPGPAEAMGSLRH